MELLKLDSKSISSIPIKKEDVKLTLAESTSIYDKYKMGDTFCAYFDCLNNDHLYTSLIPSESHVEWNLYLRNSLEDTPNTLSSASITILQDFSDSFSNNFLNLGDFVFVFTTSTISYRKSLSVISVVVNSGATKSEVASALAASINSVTSSTNIVATVTGNKIILSPVSPLFNYFYIDKLFIVSNYNVLKHLMSTSDLECSTFSGAPRLISNKSLLFVPSSYEDTEVFISSAYIDSMTRASDSSGLAYLAYMPKEYNYSVGIQSDKRELYASLDLLTWEHLSDISLFNSTDTYPILFRDGTIPTSGQCNYDELVGRAYDPEHRMIWSGPLGYFPGFPGEDSIISQVSLF